MDLYEINLFLLDIFSDLQKINLIYIAIASLLTNVVLFLQIFLQKKQNTKFSHEQRDRHNVFAFRDGKFRNFGGADRTNANNHSVYLFPPSPIFSSILITLVLWIPTYYLLSTGEISIFIEELFDFVMSLTNNVNSYRNEEEIIKIFMIIISYFLIISFLWFVKGDIPKLRELNQLKGYIGRIGFILNFVLIVGLIFLGIIAVMATSSGLLAILIYVYAFWLYIVGVVKRTRDVGLDTSWALTAFMPGIQFVYLLFLLLAGSGSMDEQ